MRFTQTTRRSHINILRISHADNMHGLNESYSYMTVEVIAMFKNLIGLFSVETLCNVMDGYKPFVNFLCLHYHIKVGQQVVVKHVNYLRYNMVS
jgi:hypothetical protein